jgi:hypothetical protein
LEGRLARLKVEGLDCGAAEFGGGAAIGVVVVEEERFSKLGVRIVREKLERG